jgi:hypothetical protein
MRNRSSACALVCVLCLVCTASAATSLYVNASTGSDVTGNGASSAPFKTITHAMNAASDPTGTFIYVAGGTYDVALGETFPILLKSLVSLVGDTQAATVIDAGQTGRVLVCSGSPAGLLLWSRQVLFFTLKNGRFVASAPGEIARGGGILCDDGDGAEFAYLVIKNNQAIGRAGTADSPDGGDAIGGGMSVQGPNVSVTTAIFLNNTAQGGAGYASAGPESGGNGGNAEGGALDTTDLVNDPYALRHMTFFNNMAKGGAGGSSTAGHGGSGGHASAGAMVAVGASRVINNIFAWNSSVAGGGAAGGTGIGANGVASIGGLSCASCSSISHNLFYGGLPSNGPYIGESAVLADPHFRNTTPGGEDLHITNCSPAEGAGVSLMQDDFDLGYVARPDRPSIGAYEATATTQLTMTPSVVYPEITPSLDIPLTVQAFIRSDYLDTEYTGHLHFTSTDPAVVLPADSTLTNGTVSFSVRFQTYGHQTITVSDTCLPGLTASFSADVLQYCCVPPLDVRTTAVSASQVNLSWIGVQTGSSAYEIWRKSETEDYTLKATVPTVSYADTNVNSNHAYVYKVRVLIGGSPGNFSVPYLTTTTVFSDPALNTLPTPVRAAHLAELQTAVNAIQRTAGKQQTTFTAIQSADMIRSSDVCAIRSALMTARGAIADLPAMSYTDSCSSGILAQGTRIKAVHVFELRRDSQ